MESETIVHKTHRQPQSGPQSKEEERQEQT